MDQIFQRTFALSARCGDSASFPMVVDCLLSAWAAARAYGPLTTRKWTSVTANVRGRRQELLDDGLPSTVKYCCRYAFQTSTHSQRVIVRIIPQWV
jgi:hypothetical protein